MNALLAQVVIEGGAWSIGNIAIAIVVLAAVVALVIVALRKFNITVPDWIAQVLWIVLVAIVIIVAIKFVLAMW